MKKVFLYFCISLLYTCVNYNAEMAATDPHMIAESQVSYSALYYCAQRNPGGLFDCHSPTLNDRVVNVNRLPKFDMDLVHAQERRLYVPERFRKEQVKRQKPKREHAELSPMIDEKHYFNPDEEDAFAKSLPDVAHEQERRRYVPGKFREERVKRQKLERKHAELSPMIDEKHYFNPDEEDAFTPCSKRASGEVKSNDSRDAGNGAVGAAMQPQQDHTTCSAKAADSNLAASAVDARLESAAAGNIPATDKYVAPPKQPWWKCF